MFGIKSQRPIVVPRIAAATLRDYEAIVAIDRASYEAPMSRASLQRRMSRAWTRGNRQSAFLCMLGSEVCGFVLFSLGTRRPDPEQDRPGSQQPPAPLVIRRLAVAPDFRRRGVATILIRQLQQWCDERGEVRATVSEVNEPGIALLRRHAFKAVGVDRFRFDDRDGYRFVWKGGRE